MSTSPSADPTVAGCTQSLTLPWPASRPRRSAFSCEVAINSIAADVHGFAFPVQVKAIRGPSRASRGRHR